MQTLDSSPQFMSYLRAPEFVVDILIALQLWCLNINEEINKITNELILTLIISSSLRSKGLAVFYIVPLQLHFSLALR